MSFVQPRTVRSVRRPALRSNPARVLGMPKAFSIPRPQEGSALTFVGWVLADAAGEEHAMGLADHVRLYLTLGGHLVLECTAVPLTHGGRLVILEDLQSVESHLAALESSSIDLGNAGTQAVRMAMQQWPLIDASSTHVK